MSCLIPLTKGKFAIVDESDFDWLNQFKWHQTVKGYAARKSPRNGGSGGMIWMHREIISPPNDKLVDHANSNKIDNRRMNLRICSKQQNCTNRKGVNKNNSSGYVGVKFDKKKKLWRADIGVGWGKVYLGRYKHIECAAMIYDMASTFFNNRFATLNFKQDGDLFVS